jgi:hypothetical protein
MFTVIKAALFSTALTLGVVFLLNRFGPTRSLVQAALMG